MGFGRCPRVRPNFSAPRKLCGNEGAGQIQNCASRRRTWASLWHLTWNSRCAPTGRYNEEGGVERKRPFLPLRAHLWLFLRVERSLEILMNRPEIYGTKVIGSVWLQVAQSYYKTRHLSLPPQRLSCLSQSVCTLVLAESGQVLAVIEFRA